MPNPKAGDQPSRPLVEGPSSRGLKIGLFREHLQEIGYLLAECKTFVDDIEIPWMDVQEFESRLLAHSDAIFLGGELAAQCAFELLEQPEEYSIYAAAYILPAIDGHKYLDAVLKALIETDEEMIPFFATALKHTPFPGTSEQVRTLLSNKNAGIRALAVEVIGYRRENQTFLDGLDLDREHPVVLTAVSRSIGRMKELARTVELGQFLASPENDLRSSVMQTLLLLGQRDTLGHLADILLQESPPHWAFELIGCAGGAASFEPLLKHRANRDLLPYVLRAMGVLGHVAAAEELLTALKSDIDAIKLAAAEGLEYLTGAGLREIHEIEEKPEEDELLESEKSPKPLIRKQERVNTSYSRWSDWWVKNRPRFRADIRWRSGKPFCLEQCVEDLQSYQSNRWKRDWAYLELAIRSGIDIPFESDWWVAKQQHALVQLREGIQNKYQQGKWLFHGKLI